MKKDDDDDEQCEYTVGNVDVDVDVEAPSHTATTVSRVNTLLPSNRSTESKGKLKNSQNQYMTVTSVRLPPAGEYRELELNPNYDNDNNNNDIESTSTLAVPNHYSELEI